ncbi:TM0106 family RecB-like putative nuclease [Agromyces atrinae]|uniref:TM0106 family RecB-like putative nuclease n=1 Tax=Agromyces atrinae TaxID=592376 RepID=A0A4Q2M921_9MICO|nr:bifunctional RecB family nuclease/DEAD/DEAH box helicase [Agromyces atrinae]NYD68355.1 uncharacterized protein [Agromyces atrinae]RXZ85600.1 TM0106 family RecB-like putative nuclease [Agromyces atrinae]
MFILENGDGSGDRVILSASDLTNASKCEFAFLRKLDARRRRGEAVPDPVDDMLARTAALGDEHEARVLDQYRREANVVEFERATLTDEGLRAAAETTREAFEARTPVVFQATFFDGGFLGYADFIVLGDDGRYLVQDTKLARRARVTALLQLAAYVDQLEKLGIPVADEVELLLGDGSVSRHAVDDIMPVFRKRWRRLRAIVDERDGEGGVSGAAVAWGDDRYTVCGQCATCSSEIETHRDVLLVAGMRVLQRERLIAAGIRSIDDLAELDGSVSVAGIGGSTLAGLAAQARLQVEASALPAGSPPPVEVFSPSALAVLPQPDPGDVFFDFEGDPLYTEGDGMRWGLDYLFGLIESDGTFRAWWAHDFAEERVALEQFLAYIAARRAIFPGMHIYHYASYERTHLLSIAARHGVGEHEVDELLREHALVDLYPLVRKALRVGSASYSIKKLEPLYMPAARAGEVTNAGDSITEYVLARSLTASGDAVGGQRVLDEIADYNRYDCESTLGLRDWLLEQASSRGVALRGAPDDDPRDPVEPSPLARELARYAGDPLDPERTDDQTAAALAAAAIDYHQREHKSFWWGHFSRLVEPLDEWTDTRDVFRVESARVMRDWYREGRQRTDRRELLLTGEWAPGSKPAPSDRTGPFLVYEFPGPYADLRADAGSRSARAIRIVSVGDDGSVIVEETLPSDAAPHRLVPSAITPSPPPPPGEQKPAIEAWARAIVDGWVGEELLLPDSEGRPAPRSWPADPMVDLLRRRPPRGTGLVPAVDGDVQAAVVESLRGLDGSYLAVQGPPGTGKTYLGSHVIARLVTEFGWRIGVVAQSHAVVENLLSAVVSAGLPARLVGKVPKDAAAVETPFTPLPRNGHLAFAAENPSGFVIGGTAWDFANPARVRRRSLDLLVIDEAGQFSLASTIAASVSARNLLLLGDPQQLPQVSQGTHPEPVDTSALGWIAHGHDVLPPELGYFLAESRRMHPAVAQAVSKLSYEGQLHSHATASGRSLDGVAAGVYAVPVEHAGNATESPEEAHAVLGLVESLLGREWVSAEGEAPRPLEASDIIVVTPYNAQLALVRDVVDSAGHDGVRVGTVDKFQGQEAAIAIVSLAASSSSDVPRGMEFLLMKNRLNVAVSRAKWAAYLVYSPALTEYLPATPRGVAELSAFIHLVERD